MKVILLCIGGVVGELSTLPGVVHLRHQEAGHVALCKALHELHCSADTDGMPAWPACYRHAGLADMYMQAATQTA